MEKRSQDRASRRLTCELVIDGCHSPALVRDASPRGLFVLTRSRPAVNSVIEVIFPAAGERPEIRVETGVARKRDVPRRLQASIPSGIGLELLGRNSDFQQWILGADGHPRSDASTRAASPTHESEASHPETPRDETLWPSLGAVAPGEEEIQTFRIRLTRIDRAETRVVTVRCPHVAGARARALTRAGRGWKILDIQVI